MSRVEYFEPVFVELMPPVLMPGKLYISTAYSVAAHLCPSGCGEKVVLPLHPQQWRFTYDGKHISVYPSVGNVGIECNSHYWIKQGHVDWASAISEQQARNGRLRDRRDLSVDAEVALTSATKQRSKSKRFARLFRRAAK